MLLMAVWAVAPHRVPPAPPPRRRNAALQLLPFSANCLGQKAFHAPSTAQLAGFVDLPELAKELAIRVVHWSVVHWSVVHWSVVAWWTTVKQPVAVKPTPPPTKALTLESWGLAGGGLLPGSSARHCQQLAVGLGQQ